VSAAANWAEWLSRTRFAGLTEDERGEFMRHLARVRDRVLDNAGLRPDDDVLDLGAGTGLLTFAAHDRIGDGWVFAVDPTVDALEELLRGAHEADLAGVMYLIGDAEVIPLPDASVDACVTRSVLMYVEDIATAAAELHRVLRPGGRISLCEPITRKGTNLVTTVDWSPLGPELAGRVAAEWERYAASSVMMRLDERDFARVLEATGFHDVRVELEALDDTWHVDDRTIDVRLDAVGAAGEPSLRQRWEREFSDTDVQRLVERLRSLAGETLTFRRPLAWVTARRS
jgi:ubiquinone/menaquinone biosynthesis C-methylase UbiE